MSLEIKKRGNSWTYAVDVGGIHKHAKEREN
jgi:hypothetical protein